MFINFLRIAKQIALITDPKIWFYSTGLYLLGVSLALALSRQQLAISSWWFILCLVWFIVTGMVIGLSHAKESTKLIFPWELVFIFLKYLLTGNHSQLRKHNDINVNISIAISCTFIFLFFLANTTFLNLKILMLSVGLFAIDFLYNSRYIDGKHKPYIDILCGMVQSIPLFIGYVLITNKLPDIRLILAGILYCVAVEAYARIIEVSANERLRGKATSVAIFGENKLLLSSITLVFLCGVIFASYNMFYFLFITPFLIVLWLSLRAESHDEMLAIHKKTFLTHALSGFLVTFYFFIAPII